MGEESSYKIVILSLLALLSLAFLPAPASADLAEDVGAWMIKEGSDLFVYGIGDSMVELGGGNVTDRTGVPALIFTTITYTVDPYQFQWVKDWWKTMLVFYVIITILAIAGGGTWALICELAPDMASRFAWLTGENPGMFQFKAWMSSVALSLAFPYLALFGVYFVLQLNYVVTAMMTSSALEAIPPTIDNIIAYIFMAQAFLFITIIMAARNIIIILMAAGSLLLAAMYLIPQLRTFVTSAFMYFLVVVFMQPLLVFTSAIGLMFIKSLPDALMPYQFVIYQALALLLVVMGVVCILGLSLVRSIIHLGAPRI